jgi:Holliday junction resolvase RusA-like endonuclease
MQRDGGISAEMMRKLWKGGDGVNTIRIWVPGEPMPQQRTRRSRYGKDYNDPRCDAWQANVKSFAGKAIMTLPDRSAVWRPLDGALWMCCVFYLTRPKTKGYKDGTPKLNRYPWPDTKPDLKNLVWGVEDALEGVVYTTDSRIVNWLNWRLFFEQRTIINNPIVLATCKVFADACEPGVMIEVGEMPLMPGI